MGYFAGNQNGCPNGGAIYAAGTPPVSAYVCNGMNGQGATRAAGPCFDNTNRYVDCGNGTVTDTVTGLIWLKNAACMGSNNWAAANQAAAGLKAGDCNLTDGSSAGDWRLPTKDEWVATIARAVALVCQDPIAPPSLTNDGGTACYGDGSTSSLVGVASANYWSSSTDETSPSGAWFASLRFDGVTTFGRFAAPRVWPVRGGSR